MSTKPQRHRTTTLDRLQRFFVGASHGCKSHMGGTTGLGGNRVSCLHKPQPPARQADHEDCEQYAECLDAAAHSLRTYVCRPACERYAPVELHADPAQRSNFPSERAIAEGLG
jgi:hypothetical protein